MRIVVNEEEPPRGGSSCATGGSGVPDGAGRGHRLPGPPSARGRLCSLWTRVGAGRCRPRGPLSLGPGWERSGDSHRLTEPPIVDEARVAEPPTGVQGKPGSPRDESPGVPRSEARARMSPPERSESEDESPGAKRERGGKVPPADGRG